MCGRFTQTQTDPQVIQQSFDLATAPEALPARYNIAPSQPIMVVVQNSQAQNEAQMMQWGLIPAWAKDRKIASSLTNARAETVHEKNSFRAAFKKRRCLVIADGFYEWRKTESGKQPMYIRMADQQVYGMAGLWEQWTDPTTQEVIHSCTLITTTPNELMATIHDRMPVIVPREDYAFWLDRREENVEALRALLTPYSADLMTAYPVSTQVNRPIFDDASLIVPLQ